MTQTKYVDKVNEQLRTQVNKVKSMTVTEEEKGEQWAEPYAFKNMKEALKFTMGFNERLVTTLDTKINLLDEKEKLVNTQAIIIEELTQELEETKTAANLQREEYESQLMS